jgi:hypothetical protein
VGIEYLKSGIIVIKLKTDTVEDSPVENLWRVRRAGYH